MESRGGGREEGGGQADSEMTVAGRANLSESGKAVLKKVGEALKGYEDKIVRVVGHTDNVPIGKSMQSQYARKPSAYAMRTTW